MPLTPTLLLVLTCVNYHQFAAAQTVPVNVSRGGLLVSSADAIIVKGSLVFPNTAFLLSFSLNNYQKDFNFRIDFLNVHTSQPLQLELTQQGIFGSIKTLLKLSTFDLFDEVYSYYADPYPQLQYLRLYFKDSVLFEPQKLVDVQIVITPRVTCSSKLAFYCQSSNECIAKSLYNDGYYNCLLGDDESARTTTTVAPTTYSYFNTAVFVPVIVLVAISICFALTCFVWVKICKKPAYRNPPLVNADRTIVCATVSQTVQLASTDVHDLSTFSLPPSYDEAVLIEAREQERLHVAYT